MFLNGYSTMGELYVGLTKYFAFYNEERPHSALKNQTPWAVHSTGIGGGALIVDKYPKGGQDQKSQTVRQSAKTLDAIV